MLKLECPRCGSANILTRLDGTSWCRRCGYEGKKELFLNDLEKKLKEHWVKESEKT